MKFRVRIESRFPRVQFLGMITSQRRRSVSRDQSRVNRVENCGNSGEYLLPGLRMILSSIKIQIIRIPSDLFTPSNSTFVAVFRTRSTSSSSYTYFSGFFQGKRSLPLFYRYFHSIHSREEGGIIEDIDFSPVNLSKPVSTVKIHPC